MAQHDYNLANQSGADFRADLNNALSAIATVNSGASEPSTTFAHQLWVDTSNNLLKIRNAANSAFITTGISITADNVFTGALTGNASTATTLATARTINGTSFDGSANISFNTDSVAEGSSNLYFTNERVDDQVNALLQAGTGIQLTYDDTAGTLTIANTNDADITGVVAGNGLTGGGTSGSVTLNVAVDDSSIEIDSDALRVKASGITNTMLAGSIANSKLVNSGVTINSQSLALGGTLVLDTDNIGEGSSNLYYTDARANSAIDARVTNTFINNLSGVVADTSTALATARTIALSGDVVGSVSFDGTADVTIASTIQANSVALGTDTTGNYVQTITGTANKITVSGSGSESADITLTLPDDVQIASDLTVAGNLTVNGTLTSLDTTNLDIEDNLFQLNAGLTGSPVNDSGMLINRGNQNNGIFMWDESVDKFTLGLTTADGTSTGNITLASLGTLVANVEGNVTGTIQTAAQPNITSLGTLSTLTVDDITINGSTISDAGDLTIDAGGDIELNADGSTIVLKDNTLSRFTFNLDSTPSIQAQGTSLEIETVTGDADILFKGNDNGVDVTALTLDMSDGGTAIFNHDVKLDDNGKAIFGAGSDLQIYHDGSSSYIKDVGTGGLFINGSQVVVASSTGEVMFNAIQDAQVILYHNNSAKLETTSTGIDVTGTATMDGLTVNSGTTNTVATFTSTDSGAGIQLTDSTGSSKLETSGANLRISVDDDGAVANSAIQFRVDGSTKATLNSSGNLGLGTDSPSAKLDVNGEVYISPNTAGKNTFQLTTNASNDARLKMKSDTTDKVDIQANGNSYFNGGNVAIGTDSPNSYSGFTTLTIDGTSGSLIDLEVNGTVTGEVYSDASNGIGIQAVGSRDIQFKTNNTEALRIDSNQNVGIGTSSPDRQLSINDFSGNGTLSINASTSGASTMYFADGSSGTSIYAGYIQYSHADNSMQFATNGGTERMRIDSSGNVGIGTTSPANKLHVLHTGDAGLKLETDGDSDSNFIHFKSSAGTSQGYIGNESSTAGTNFTGTLARAFVVGATSSGTATQFLSAGTVKATILSSGNVGIGTTSPSQLLHLKSSGTDATGIGVENSQRYYAIRSDNFSLVFTDATVGSERFRLDSAGQLLIGKTASDNTTVGTRINGSGFISSVVDGDNAVLLNRLNSDGSIVLFRKDGTSVGSINTVSDDLAILSSISGHKGLRFGAGAITPTTNTAAIDNGNTDLGGNSIRFKDLYLAGTANVNKVSVDGSGANGIDLEADSSATTNSNRLFFSTSAGTNSIMGVSGALTFRTGATAGSASGTERMRISDAGTVLVGKTAEGTATDGIELNRNDVIVATRNNDAPLLLNRRSSDGDIIYFRKDNTAVGSIGTIFDDLYIGTGDTNIRFNDGNDEITPRGANGAARDNAISLGASSTRFKDLHLSGTATMDGLTVSSGSAMAEFRSTGNGNSVIDLRADGTGDPQIYFNLNGATVFSTGVDNSDGNKFKISANYQLGTNDRFAIDSSGNIGIGTNTPDSHVHIRNNADATGATLKVADSANRAITITSPIAESSAAGRIAVTGTANSLEIGVRDYPTALKIVGSSGNVGIGTTSPSSRLETVGGDGITISNSGDTFLQLKTTGTTATNYIEFKDSGGSAGNISYNHTDNYLATKVNGSERMRIDSSGNLLVGATSFNYGSQTATQLYHGGGRIDIGNNTTSTAYNISFYNNNGNVGKITTSGSSTNYATSSDYRLKENVDYTFNALDRVAQLKPARFNFIADADNTVDGFLAHEVQDIVPEAVTGEKDGDEMQGIDQSKLVPLLTKAIQEQQAQIEELKQQIQNLTGE